MATLSLLVSTFISLLLVVVGDSVENVMLSDEPSIGLLAKVLEFIEFSASTLLILRITVFLKLVVNERSKRYAKSKVEIERRFAGLLAALFGLHSLCLGKSSSIQ